MCMGMGTYAHKEVYFKIDKSRSDTIYPFKDNKKYRFWQLPTQYLKFNVDYTGGKELWNLQCNYKAFHNLFKYKNRMNSQHFFKLRSIYAGRIVSCISYIQFNVLPYETKAGIYYYLYSYYASITYIWYVCKIYIIKNTGILVPYIYTLIYGVWKRLVYVRSYFHCQYRW